MNKKPYNPLTEPLPGPDFPDLGTLPSRDLISGKTSKQIHDDVFGSSNETNLFDDIFGVPKKKHGTDVTLEDARKRRKGRKAVWDI